MTRLRFLPFVLALFCTLAASAAAKEEFDPMTASIEENIAFPAVEAKRSGAVAAAIGHFIATLRHAGYEVDAVRKGEVAMVTIRCAELFAPNSTELLTQASKKLAPLLPYIMRSDNYKVIVAVHSDNTGDEMYADRLTSDRANAIDEYYFHASGDKETGIIPYGLGSDEPVAPNSGMANREKNRRVEIYFVPTAELIDKIKRNK